MMPSTGPSAAPQDGAGAPSREPSPGASRTRSYFVAGAVGAIAGETVASAGVIFAMAALPAHGVRPVAAALLSLGFLGGASAGVLLLRRWYRSHAKARK